MYCHQSKWFWPFCGQQRPRRADCSYVRDNAAHPASNLGHCCGGPQTSQKSKRYLIILSARSVTCSKFHTQNHTYWVALHKTWSHGELAFGISAPLRYCFCFIQICFQHRAAIYESTRELTYMPQVTS